MARTTGWMIGAAAVVLGGSMLWGQDAATGAAKPQALPAGYFVFATPWNDTVGGVATDVSFLNDRPAGKNGHIVVKDGHFVEESSGKRVRFLGVNIAATDAYPDKADAELFAKRLAKAGVNIARMHHLDNPWAIQSGGSIWDKSRADRQVPDPAQLDKLDYLIYQLKLNGIYVNLNLKVSKELTAADGMPETITKVPFTHQKRIDYFQKRMVELQKDYARRLLTHVNPYSGMSYAQDPAVACVEINNENSLLGFWSRTPGKGLETLPEPFKTELEQLWTDWLQKKYGTDEKLKAAWMEGVTPAGESILSNLSVWTFESQGDTRIDARMQASANAKAAPEMVADVQKTDATDWHVQAHIPGLTLQEGAMYTLSFKAKADAQRKISVGASKDADDWHNVGLMSSVDVGTELKPYALTFKATNTAPGHTRIAFTLGNAVGKVWISEMELSPGAKGAGLQAGDSLAKLVHMPLMATDPQWKDWTRFLVDTERSYSDQMLAVLKDELKIRANVALTQVDYGGTAGMNREARMDFADGHAYWQHPSFVNGDWNPERWTIKNTPQVAVMSESGFGELGNLSMMRVAGKPFTVSEYDHPAPSDYVCEMMPEYCTFAALQDWDIIYTFATASYGAKEKPDRITGYFDQNNHPAKWSFYPTAALVFRQGLIKPAKAVATVEMPAPMWESFNFTDDAWKKLSGGKPGFLERRLQVSDKPLVAGNEAAIKQDGKPVTGPITLVKTKAGQVYVASSPSSATFVGYVGGETLKAGDVTLETASFGNNFAAVTAVAADGKAMKDSKRILVTVCGKVENQGMVWNKDRTSIGSKWGVGPSIAEHVPAKLTLKVDGPRKVYALRADGTRSKQVEAGYEKGWLTMGANEADATILYEIAAE